MAFKGGLGTLAIVVVISLLTGQNPLKLLSQMQTQSPATEQTGEYQASPEEQELAQFVTVVLGSTEDVWHEIMKDYRDPTLTMFTDAVNSGCGQASSAVGPFYCSEDEHLYIDLGFYNELKDRFGAPGDFAQAYVIAHEVGHHVQKLLGITDKVHAQRERLSEAEFNKLSVKLELQADFLAGVWANHAQKSKNILEPGDLEEALRAANAIGDDQLQRQSRGYVVPDSFTHGTSEQRVRWFRKGFETGDLAGAVDLFNLNYRDL